jgi:Transcriptional regulatory protein, C terminal
MLIALVALPDILNTALQELMQQQGNSVVIAVDVAAIPANTSVALVLDAGLDCGHVHKIILNPPITAATLCTQLAHLPTSPHQDIRLDAAQRQLYLAQKTEPISLTEKETHIIEIMLASAPHPTNKAVLITEVFGIHDTADSHTLETHIYRLRQKIGTEWLQSTDDGYQLRVR